MTTDGQRTLMERIREKLAPIPVMTIADLGVSVDAHEAIGAIVNSNETILGHDISRCGAEPDDRGRQGAKVVRA